MASSLLIGGVRSGKSAWAVNYARKFKRKLFIATAEPCDDDMKQRIHIHQEERGEGWTTIEAGRDILPALENSSDQYDCIVIDCLTVWTALIMAERESQQQVIQQWIEPLVQEIPKQTAKIVIVTNEVGLSVHPEYKSGRRYRDLLGMVNQKFARACDHVLFFVAGVPIAVKGSLPEGKKRS